MDILLSIDSGRKILLHLAEDFSTLTLESPPDCYISCFCYITCCITYKIVIYHITLRGLCSLRACTICHIAFFILYNLVYHQKLLNSLSLSIRFKGLDFFYTTCYTTKKLYIAYVVIDWIMSYKNVL